MLSSKLLLPTALTAFTVLAPPALADRYVEVDAAQVGTCTQATPCNSIQLAANSAIAGETIHVGAGTFTEAVSTSKRLHFQGAGRGATIVHSPERYPAFDLSGGGSIRALKATRGAGPLQMPTVRLMSSVASVHREYDVRDVEIASGRNTTDGYGAAALAALGQNDARMDLVVENARLEQINDGFTDNPTVLLDNTGSATISDVAIVPDAHGGVPGGVEPGAAITADGDVTATITDAHTEGTAGGGILAAEGADLTVHRGRFVSDHHALAVGYAYSQSDETTLKAYDSVFATTGTRSNRRAVEVRGADGHAATVELVRSTVLTAAADPATGLRATATSGGVAAVELRDTVVDTFDTGPASPAPDVDLVEDGGAVTLTAQRSAFAAPATAGAPEITATSTVAADPQFADPAALDLQPRAGSPLVDAGDPALLTATDAAGAPRSQDGDGDGTPRTDIGAYERAALVQPPQTDGVTGNQLPAVQHQLPAVQHQLPAVQNQLPAVQRSVRDRLAPALKGLKLRGGKARFTLSEAAKVTLSVEKRAGKRWKRVARSTSDQRAGARALRLAKLGKGTFRITVVAVDAAGNRTTKRITKGS